MSKFERVLAVDSTALPDCRCGVEMHLISIVPVPGGDSEIRVFRCPDCNHELSLTIWHDDVPARVSYASCLVIAAMRQNRRPAK
jgi:hypothetical protein